MPTTLLKGDLFNTPGLRAYAQGCNCAGAMDAGVSVAFKKRWPRMFEEYALRCKDNRFNLGDVFVWSEGDETVYNLAIQQHWKTRSKAAALSRAVDKMVSLAQQAGITRIGLPRIGAGLGGLDWPRVTHILKERGETTKIELLVFEQFVRAAPTTPPADVE
jgi:O-acetyl-ADP-ribose deacetylase (regulator of RNase III)